MDDGVFERITKALADPSRFEILRLVVDNPGIACCEIVERVSLRQPTVSHHLKELAGAGLVASKRDGAFTRLAACNPALEGYVAELSSRLAVG